MTEITGERYNGLDILKSICAFLIVSIHVPFPGEGGEYFLSLTRMAVPVFFMITGFFYDSVRKRGHVKAQINNVFRLFLIANLLYFGWGAVNAAVEGSMEIFLQENFGIRKLLRFVLLNEALFSSHLWYLGALLYVLVIRAVLDKYLPQSSEKILYALTPVLLIGDLMFGKYSLVVFGRTFPHVLVRNFLFVGIPYFSIGCYLYKMRERISIRREWNILLILLFACTTLLERYLLVRAGLNAARDHYISSTFLAAAVFILFMDGEWDRSWAAPLEKIGREYSAFIYIIHPLLLQIIEKAAGPLDTLFSEAVTRCYMMLRPVVIYAVSILAAAGYYMIKKKIGVNRTGKGGRIPERRK